jgi:3-oxoacyl-[acyl-carrier protein] reductase
VSPLLEGRVAIVTGAGRGIGAATARLFAREGARVVVSDLDAEPAQAVAASIQEAGGEALVVAGDVTGPDFPAQLVQRTVETFGALDILVNAAGYTWDGMVHKMTDRQWEAMLDVHVTAPFRLIRAAAPRMRDAAKAEKAAGQTPRPRSIVNVTSVAGVYGNPGQANYAAGKAGLIGLTKTIAKEWGPLGIRCNAVAFGFITTRLTDPKQAGATVKRGDAEIALGIPEELRGRALQMISLGRAGSPEEAATSILFLASPLSSYVNGHVLEVTGGLTG